MRRKILSNLISALLVITIVATAFLAGLGAAPPAAEAQPGSTTVSPEGLMLQAVVASGNVTSGGGDFSINVAVSADTARMPAGMQALWNQPMSLAGTYSFTGEPAAFESAMTLGVAGQSLPVGLKAVDGRAWVQFLGQWYETDLMTGAGTTGTTMTQADKDSFIQSLFASGIDPRAWMTDLTLAGEEGLGTTATYHLTGTLNTDRMLADIFALLQDPALQRMGGGLDMPTQEELRSAQATVSAWLDRATMDVWIAKETNQFRQFQLEAMIVPPAGEGDGIDSLTARATVSIDPAAVPTAITPPADARPFSELERSLQMLEGLFSGMGSMGPSMME